MLHLFNPSFLLLPPSWRPGLSSTFLSPAVLVKLRASDLGPKDLTHLSKGPIDPFLTSFLASPPNPPSGGEVPGSSLDDGAVLGLLQVPEAPEGSLFGSRNLLIQA